MKEVIREKLASGQQLETPLITPRTSVHLPAIPGKVFAVIGMRRAGKTTYLYQKIAELRSAGIPSDRLVYFNFEDERLAGMRAGDLGLILEEYYLQYPDYRGRKTVWFFFDEIQTVAGWEKFTRRILDSEKVELYLSGSSARLLSREVATSMRGRAVEAVIYPFSFAEYLIHRGEGLPENPAFLSGRQQSIFRRELENYLRAGGFPEAQGISDRDRRHLLQSYVDVVILRDIMERHSLTNLSAVRWMVRHLLANAGGAFSANRFHKILQAQKIPCSVAGLLEIFSHLEDAFLVHGLRIEGGSERKRQVNPLKVYPVDSGLIPVFDRTGRENLGHALENVIMIELLRRGAEVTWVRTPAGFEVDFCVRHPDQTVELIQVCAFPDTAEVLSREVRALVDARTDFPKARTTLITLNPVRENKLPDEIQTISAWEWLLVK